MRKNKRMGRIIHHLKKLLRNKKEAELFYYILKCFKDNSYRMMTAQGILQKYKSGELSLNTQSPYYRRLKKIS